MPGLDTIRKPIKAILAASSGYGKTGSLWSLAAAGFKLRIYDGDRGVQILGSILKKHCPEALANVQVNTFTNKLKGNIKGFAQPSGSPDAWPRFANALNKWPDNPEEGANTWGPDTIIVIDSLTMFGRHALLWAQHAVNSAGKKPEWTDYGNAQAQVESIFSMLYADEVRCHVLFLTHVKDVRDKEGNFLGAFPSSVGSALNDVIPRYVNNILSIKLEGMGGTTRRRLSTVPTSNQIATKTEELNVQREYTLTQGTEPKPGLAEFFADCGWPSPET